MKKHFSDELLISILHEAEAGISACEIWRKHAISNAILLTLGVRSMAAGGARS